MLATAPRSPRSATGEILRAACAVQAVALLVALLALAYVERIIVPGVGALGIGGAAGAVAWRFSRRTA